ncbi:MAG: FMN-binding protein [Betaproteobacteria bacterium]
MNAPVTETTQPVLPTGAMIRTLGLVSAICGLIIVGAYQGTFSAVQANKRLATERAVFKVVPAAKSIGEFVATSSGSIEPLKAGTEPPSGTVKFYAGYDAAGQLVGIAAEGGAKGYADTVRLMFGYSPACQCINGLGIVSSRETPGIGDKVDSSKPNVDKAFMENFVALDAKLNAEMKALANEIKAVKHGTKTNPWQIDAIAGATITSRAVGNGINAAAQDLLPKLVPNLDKVRTKP